MKLSEVAKPHLTAFDNEGLGSTPITRDVDYFGVIVKMKPSIFLHLCAFLPRDQATTADAIKQKIQTGEKIAPPFLLLTPTDDEELWKVSGHEGRNRMHALYEMYGDIPMPVHLFPQNGMRARHITSELLNTWKAKLISENGTPMIGPLFKK